jgi:hypothetical protein
VPEYDPRAERRRPDTDSAAAAVDGLLGGRAVDGATRTPTLKGASPAVRSAMRSSPDPRLIWSLTALAVVALLLLARRRRR